MTFEQIDFFMSCAACLNFSLAAKYHFVSVSTLSRSISSLENELGIKLFDRGYHGHKLTDNGRDLFISCVNSSMEFNKSILRCSNIYSDTILFGCYATDESFKKLITAYAKCPSDYSPKKFKVIFIPEKHMLDAIKEGTIALGIIDSSEFNDDKNLRAESFCKDGEREYFIVSKDSFNEDIFSRFSSLGN